MSDKTALVSSLRSFYAKNLITDVINTVKSGKEATVYRCRAHPSTGRELAAAKVYRSFHHRSFRNDAIYQQGRIVWSGGNSRALRNKSKWGRSVQFSSWVASEFEALKLLHSLGADVPQPFAKSRNAILMEYVGDEQSPAPTLSSVSLGPDEPEALFQLLMRNVSRSQRH